MIFVERKKHGDFLVNAKRFEQENVNGERINLAARYPSCMTSLPFPRRLETPEEKTYLIY